MRIISRALIVTATVAALTAPAATAVAAAPDSPGTFGPHIASCAQAGEFNANHNPGMHSGASGWDGHTC